jgi:hypothetical protein
VPHKPDLDGMTGDLTAFQWSCRARTCEIKKSPKQSFDLSHRFMDSIINQQGAYQLGQKHADKNYRNS